MKIKNTVLVQLGFLFISASFCSTALAKNKKAEVEHIEVEDSTIIHHPDTKPVALGSKQAIIVDYDSGKILLEKNSKERMVPGSMTKMMTSYLIEEKLKKGEASGDMLLDVSEKAWRTQGSKTFVPLGEKVRLDDMLKGIIIQSGNDASIVAAEGLYGSEENFVDAMNNMASQMGLKDTHFENASGWPSPDHYSTAYDLAQIGVRVVKDHPEYYSIYSEKSFTFGKDSKGNPITQGNRNTLLYKDLGCDGIKSGHTDEGGYGLVLSFINDGRRYVGVINGLKTGQKRSEEAFKVLNWVRENFINKKIFSKGDMVESNAPVKSGVRETVQLLVNEDVYILLPRANPSFKTENVLDTPLEAPLKKGDVVGKVKITYGNNELDIPVIANENIEEVGFLKKLYRKIMPS